jgi:xanthine dehydrogenase YagS FAD-binding subunit
VSDATLYNPSSFEAAAVGLAKFGAGGAMIKGGGGDLALARRAGIKPPPRIINLMPLHDPVDTIKALPVDRVIVLNATTTVAEIVEHDGIRDKLPALHQAAASIASPQIRSIATVGGNLFQHPACAYFRHPQVDCLRKGGGGCPARDGDGRFLSILGDAACPAPHPSTLATALAAYRADAVLVRGGQGDKATRRTIPLEDLLAGLSDNREVLQPNEILVELRVPLDALGKWAAYREMRNDAVWDRPLVACAVELNNLRAPSVVLGGVAAVPWRVRQCEALLTGSSIDDDLIQRVAKIKIDASQPIPDSRYKLDWIPHLLTRTIRAARTHAAER